ncbi:MAG: alpha-ketoglutarate-dependent dioxygenase AlkB [bacterium]
MRDHPRVARPKPPRSCACTGVRWCARCLDPRVRAAQGMDAPTPLPEFLREPPERSRRAEDPGVRIHAFDPVTRSCPTCPDFEGLHLLEDLLSEEEADRLLAVIDREPFQPAQSGKEKQHFGARVNFNKRKVNANAFEGLPGYAAWLETRTRERWARESREPDEARRRGAHRPGLVRALSAFRTTDVFVLRYRSAERSNLDFHVDDRFAYGEAILALSLESDGVMTFLRPGASDRPGWDCVRVALPTRSMSILYGPARYEWEHAILSHDVQGRRTSISLRTLSEPLRRTAVGRVILERAGRRWERCAEAEGASEQGDAGTGSRSASSDSPHSSAPSAAIARRGSMGSGGASDPS